MSDTPRRRASGAEPHQQEGLARTGQLIAVLFFGVAAACGFFSAAKASQPGPTTTIDVIDYSFAPAQINVPVGGVVIFRNDGRVLHRVVADNGGFDSHGLQPAHTWSVIVGNRPGTITYHDAIYPQMSGRIVVTTPVAGPVDAASVTTAVTVGATGARTGALATTGNNATRMLAFIAVAFLTFGIAALMFARPSPVRLMVLGPIYSDDLLPVSNRDRARRS